MVTSSDGRRTLVVVVLATALIVIDTTIIGVGLPVLSRELGGSLAGSQWVVVGYAVTFGALILPTAALSDRLGRRRLFVAGVAAFTVASTGCALAWSMLALGVLRTLQGVGAGMIFATAVPLVAGAHSEQRRPMALAIWAAAAGSCSAVGPFLGGMLVELGGWRSIFLINLPLGVLALALAHRWLAPSTPSLTRHERRLRPAERYAAAGLVTGLLLVFYVLNTGPRQGWSPALSVTAAVGVALLVVTLAGQARSPRPLVDLRLLGILRFSGAATLSFVTRFTTMAAPVFLVLYLQRALGSSPFVSGLTLVPMFAAAFCGGLLAGRAQARWAVAPVVAGGFACSALGAAGTALVIAPDAPPGLVAVALVPFGLGFGLSSTPLIAVAVAAAPQSRAGMATGLANCLIPMGTAAGTAVFGIAFGGDVTAPQPVADGAARVMLAATAASVLAAALAGWSLRTPAAAPPPAREAHDGEVS